MLAAILGAVVLGWALMRVLAGYPSPDPAPRNLWRGEAAFLHAAADAIYPPGGPVPPSGSEAGLGPWVDAYVGSVPTRMRVLMRLLFFLMEHATLVFAAPASRGRRRFSALTAVQQQAVLESWRTSSFFPRRLVFTSLRAILSMGYFADPEVQRLLDVAPRAIETPQCEADWLYPAIGRSRRSLAPRPADWEPPPPAPPLDAHTPLHPFPTPPGAP